MLDSTQVGGSPTCFHPREQAFVEHRIATCVARAKELAQPLLLRLRFGLDCSDPWTLLPRTIAQTPRFFAWHDGRSKLCFLASGDVQNATFDTATTWDDARAFSAQLLEKVVEFGIDQASIGFDLPLAVGGLAFRPKHSVSADDAWQGWPDGQLWVPRLLVYGRDDTAIGGHHRSGGILHRVVFPDSRAAELTAEIAADIAAVQAQVQQPTAHISTACPPFAHVEANESKEAWGARVLGVRDAIAAGDVDKVVMARSWACQLPDQGAFDRTGILLALRAGHPESISFAVGQNDGSCFLGATPEILAEVSGRNLHTQALAGTTPRGTTVAEDQALGDALLNSGKNRTEHGVVTQVLAKTLEPLCAQLNFPKVPQLVRLPRVQHLETPFCGVLRQTGRILDLVERLHPTPSVGGWPRDAATGWLEAHEPLNRGWYAGPVGWLTAAGDGAFAVAIRSLLVHGDRAWAFAGAGIVADSEPEAEWDETELKLQTALGALRMEAK